MRLFGERYHQEIIFLLSLPIQCSLQWHTRWNLSLEKQFRLGGLFTTASESVLIPIFLKMRLLETKYQSGFRDAPEVEYPGVGSIRQVGPGAGNYTFIKVKEAGHSASCTLFLLGDSTYSG